MVNKPTLIDKISFDKFFFLKTWHCKKASFDTLAVTALSGSLLKETLTSFWRGNVLPLIYWKTNEILMNEDRYSLILHLCLEYDFFVFIG